jgi:hypothetical protein
MDARVIMCSDCGELPAHSRGLCNTCYTRAYRSGTLGDYPTNKFIEDPESHIRWAFGHYPDLVKDIAVEYGLRVTSGSDRP